MIQSLRKWFKPPDPVPGPAPDPSYCAYILKLDGINYRITMPANFAAELHRIEQNAIRYEAALKEIDRIAASHKRGAIGEAQKVARVALGRTKED